MYKYIKRKRECESKEERKNLWKWCWGKLWWNTFDLFTSYVSTRERLKGRRGKGGKRFSSILKKRDYIVRRFSLPTSDEINLTSHVARTETTIYVMDFDVHDRRIMHTTTRKRTRVYRSDQSSYITFVRRLNLSFCLRRRRESDRESSVSVADTGVLFKISNVVYNTSSSSWACTNTYVWIQAPQKRNASVYNCQ